MSSAVGSYRPPFRRKPRSDTSEEWCSNCKKSGHNRKGWWWLYPQLRPRGWKQIDKSGGGGATSVEVQKKEKEEKGRGFEKHNSVEKRVCAPGGENRAQVVTGQPLQLLN
jgi:hypothetical protein